LFKKTLADLRVERFHLIQRNNYPLAVIIEVKPSLSIRMRYQRSDFREEVIEMMADALGEILERMAANAEGTLADVLLRRDDLATMSQRISTENFHFDF
jgi:hypothetical protein